jgi:uncharacterized protein with beta-barrel porin domain
VGNETISDFAPDNADARLVLDFPSPEAASAETEVIIDGAAQRFDQIQSRLGGRREGEARFSGFLSAGTRFGDRGLGDSLVGDQTTTLAGGGVDYAFTPDLVIGAAFFADKTDADLPFGGKLKAKSYSPSLYAGWRSGRFHLDGYAAYTSVDYDSRRVLPIGASAFTATASPDGKAYTFAAAAGYRLGSGAFTFGPIADLVATQVRVDGYEEANAEGFGSTLEGRTRDSTRLGLGMEARYAAAKSWGVLVVNGKVRAVQELSDKRDLFNAAFTAQPDVVFAVRGPKTGVTYGALDLGLAAVTKTGFQFGVSYAPRFDDDGLVDQAALVSISKTF